MPATSENPLFVFLHGAGLGAYIWDELIQALPYETLAIDFPYRGDSAKIPTHNTLEAYVSHGMKQLSPFGGRPIVLVVHSIGGCVGLELAARLGDRLTAFVAISAAIPKTGQSFMDMFPFVVKQLSLLFLRILGTKPPEKVLRNSLCNGLNEQQAAKIVRNYTAEPLALYTDKVTVDLPETQRMYIILQQDKSFTVNQQNRFAKQLKCDTTYTLDAGHLGMMSHPIALAEILSFIN